MEFLKLVILAGIATLCSGQIGSGDMIPEPSTVRVVTATRFYRDLASYQRIYFPNETGHVIYEMSAPNRYSRYNCLERDAVGNITNRVPANYVFTVFLQMPVLHFLELRYKIRLMDSIRARIGIPRFPTAPTRTDDLATFTTEPEICIDGYDQAFVGSFDEGIMLRIYQQPSATGRLNGDQLRTAFVGNAGGVQVVRFEGMTAIDYTPAGGRPVGRSAVIGPSWNGRVSINFGGCRQLDPRFNSGMSPAELACRSLDTDEQDDIRDGLAENPDPINFYLEAGDYVFAVIGSIAVAIVLGLAILGYCIHPFFLA